MLLLKFGFELHQNLLITEVLKFYQIFQCVFSQFKAKISERKSYWHIILWAKWLMLSLNAP